MSHIDYNNIPPNILLLLNNKFPGEENKKRLICAYCSRYPDNEVSILKKYFKLSNITNKVLEWLSTNLLEYQTEWTKKMVNKYLLSQKIINEKYFCFVDTNHHRFNLNDSHITKGTTESIRRRNKVFDYIFKKTDYEHLNKNYIYPNTNYEDFFLKDKFVLTFVKVSKLKNTKNDNLNDTSTTKNEENIKQNLFSYEYNNKYYNDERGNNMYNSHICYNDFNDKDEFNMYHYEYIKIPLDTNTNVNNNANTNTNANTNANTNNNTNANTNTKKIMSIISFIKTFDKLKVSSNDNTDDNTNTNVKRKLNNILKSNNETLYNLLTIITEAHNTFTRIKNNRQRNSNEISSFEIKSIKQFDLKKIFNYLQKETNLFDKLKINNELLKEYKNNPNSINKENIFNELINKSFSNIIDYEDTSKNSNLFNHLNENNSFIKKKEKINFVHTSLYNNDKFKLFNLNVNDYKINNDNTKIIDDIIENMIDLLNKSANIEIYYNFGMSFSYLDINTIKINDVMPNKEILYNYIFKDKFKSENKILIKYMKIYAKTKINHLTPEQLVKDKYNYCHFQKMNLYNYLLEKVPDVYKHIYDDKVNPWFLNSKCQETSWSYYYMVFLNKLCQINNINDIFYLNLVHKTNRDVFKGKNINNPSTSKLKFSLLVDKDMHKLVYNDKDFDEYNKIIKFDPLFIQTNINYKIFKNNSIKLNSGYYGTNNNISIFQGTNYNYPKIGE